MMSSETRFSFRPIGADSLENIVPTSNPDLEVAIRTPLPLYREEDARISVSPRNSTCTPFAFRTHHISSAGFVQPTCEICFQVCKIPVKMTCFPCFQRTKIHCHSIKRFCYTCARQYLELDVRANDRSTSKKCLYCDSIVDLHRLRTNDCMEKDFFVMSLDTSQYNCIYQGCQFIGTQNDIHRHLPSCSYLPRRCRGCSQTIIAKDMDTHIRICEGRIRCDECGNFVYANNFNRHLLQHHGLKRCEYCEETVNDHTYQDHMDNHCPYRPTRCDYCECVYTQDDEIEHLCSHLSDCHKRDVELLMESRNIRKQMVEIRDRIYQL